MKIYIRILVWSMVTVLLMATSCEKKEAPIPNEEELITTLVYTLTTQDGSSQAILSFVDLDGDGGQQPTVNTQALSANTTYNGTIELLNEQESPSVDVTEEVAEEGEEHQFFYQSSLSDIAISYQDKDLEDRPIGIKTQVTTGSAGSGTLTITLRHEPNKTADGVANGNIANAGGETDIEVVFDVQVQ